MGDVDTTDLDRFDVSRDAGFLPDAPPPETFGADAEPFLRRLDALPELLASDRLRPLMRELSPPAHERLEALRVDMPPAHRAFIEAAAAGPDIRTSVRDSDAGLREAFNECLDRMVRFRELHREVVQSYLAEELGESEGTGGTPYNRFLTMFVDDTEACKLPR